MHLLRLFCRLERVSQCSTTKRSHHTDNDLVELGIYEKSYQKAKSFVSKLTTAQKVSIITGGDVNGTEITWSALGNKDGFAGINSQYYVSGFPMGNALAMTWSRQHFEDEAKASGREFYLMGYNLINGMFHSSMPDV
jgi:beta-glucosidase